MAHPLILRRNITNDSNADSDREEGDLAKLAGMWSDSAETLNEHDSDARIVEIPTTTRPQLDDRFFPSLATRSDDRMLLTFETDKRRRTTRLCSNGKVMYSFASLYENPSSKAGLYTQLRNGNGDVIATHIISPASKSLVKIGNEPPIQRKAWLEQCGILSLNCGKFQVGGRWFKWRCLNDSGRVSVILRDHSSKSNATVARFTCIHRIEKALLIPEGSKCSPRPTSSHQLPNHSRSHSRLNTRVHSRRRSRSWRGSLELNPDYKDVWDYAVFSLIVLECLKGGRTIPPLEYEDESGSNVSYLANLIGLFAGTG